MQARNEVRHGQQENRSGEKRGEPEAPGHIFGVGIFLVRFLRDCNGLESHSADWAVAGVILADLRMHRTGVAGLCFFLKRGTLLNSRPAVATIVRFISLNAARFVFDLEVHTCSVWALATAAAAGGTFVKSGMSPSSMVGWVKMASRNAV